MKYDVLRPQIKSGDILAWSEGGWKNWHDIQVSVVRMMTQSEYSHVGLAYVIGGRVFVVEAVVPLIRIFPLSKLTPFYYLKTPDNWWSDNAEKRMLSWVGLPYSKWEAIKSFLSKDTNGDTVWECAKLVNRTLAEFDPGLDDIHDTPTATIRHVMAEHDLTIQYIEK